jgi:DNA-binding LytR/AlgR family response regulator
MILTFVTILNALVEYGEADTFIRNRSGFWQCQSPVDNRSAGLSGAKLARTEVSNVGHFATSDRASPQRGEVFLDDATHAGSRGTGGIARIAIKEKGRVLFVDPRELIVARAEENYVALVHKSGAYLVRETLSTTEQKLISFGFVRIHRSILVNTTLVKDLRRDNAGRYVLRTTDGSEHPVGRAYRGNLKMIARSWLGVACLSDIAQTSGRVRKSGRRNGQLGQ